MKALLTALIIVFALISSCKKEKKVNFPQELYATKISVKTQFRLYTNTGEITNSDVKNRFKTNPDFYSLENQQITPNEKMTFLSQDTAIFGTSTIKFSISKSENQFLFYSPNIVQGSSNNLINDILKYTATRIQVPPFNNFDYLTKEVRVANGNYKNLNFSVLSYFLRSNHGSSSRQSGYLFNEFNENALSKLRVNDTLAIQEYTINFKAK